MKKILLLTVCVIAFGFSITKAQTSDDFTANDCNSVSHTLYSTLDSGKVIVMAWVMPCSSCIGPSLTAYNISQSYSTTNPGQVQFYLLDDVGNTNCSTVTGWGTNNNIGPNLFSFSSTSLLESMYGAGGMPKIVIVGGVNHKIYYSVNGSSAGNSTNIQNAINLALSEVAGISESETHSFELNIYPNPVSDNMIVSCSNNQPSDLNFQIVNSLGEIVYVKPASGNSSLKNEINFDLKGVANGIYFLRIISDKNIELKKFVVLH